LNVKIGLMEDRVEMRQDDAELGDVRRISSPIPAKNTAPVALILIRR
jgi:hypothetical protein